MQVSLLCPSCNPGADQFAVDLLPKNDCVYEIQCPYGHKFRANILYHEFQKLFEVAVNALADGYYREAVGSFAASYERFIELFIRITIKISAADDDKFPKMWKQMSRQSERQLGAFIALFVREFGTQPPLLADTQIELRNKVVHQGYFPSKEQCLKYGSAVLSSIRQTIRVLCTSEAHHSELSRSINDQGDVSKDGPNFHYYAHPLIGTNRPPGLDVKTLEEMLADATQLRAHSPRPRGA